VAQSSQNSMYRDSRDYMLRR